MPADKVIVLAPCVRKSIRSLVEEKGFPVGRYKKFLDLSRTDLNLPVRLSCNGCLDDASKIEIIGVAHLGLTRTEEIVKSICETLNHAKIYRIDWAVDIWDISPSQLAACCRFSGIQSSAFFQSRLGATYYPHKSNERTILIYDKLKLLRSKNHSSVDPNGQLTRLEVQFRGKGVPIKRFDEIRGYGEIDLLKGLKLMKLRRPPKDAKPKDVLVFEALDALRQNTGLQSTAKKFTSSQWAYFQKKYFAEVAKNEFPDVLSLLTTSVRDWLADIIRFPRSKP